MNPVASYVNPSHANRPLASSDADQTRSINAEYARLIAERDEKIASLEQTIARLQSSKSGDLQLNIIDASTLRKESVLGSGGYGEVWKMEWMGRSVAVKWIAEASQDRSLIETARAEAALMAQLQHPCIVSLYGIVDGAECGVVMEFLSGGSLYDLLKGDEAMDDGMKIRMAREISSGVWFLHSNNIVHRDIKSGNVMLTGDLHCKLIDFGLSQLKQKLHELGGTMTGTLVGSLEWMAPELVSVEDDAQGVSYNKSTDVYALGITMWEIAARKLPYQAAGPAGPQRQAKIIALKMQRKHDAIPNDAPACIAQAIERCRADALRPSAAQLLEMLQ